MAVAYLGPQATFNCEICICQFTIDMQTYNVLIRYIF